MKQKNLTERRVFMWNYDHEIQCPSDKAIENYLWCDYFHDSGLLNMDFSGKKDKISLSFLCGRDMENDWEKLEDKVADKRAYFEENRDKYIYFLTFEGCRYYASERIPQTGTYLNGRFKNSVILQKMEAADPSPQYHFRMQFDDGYTDFVFKKFVIRKKIGRIRYDEIQDIDYKTGWLKSYKNGVLLTSNGNLNKEKVLLLANSGGDIERHYALTYLAMKTKLNLVKTSRAILQIEEDYTMSKISAIYTLGLQGEEQDLGILQNFIYDYEVKQYRLGADSGTILLPKRFVADACDQIRCRITKKL